MEIFNIKSLTRAEQQWVEFMFEEWVHYRMKPFYKSMNNIDKEIGISESTQLRGIKKLKQQGIIEVNTRPTSKRTIRQNYYSFLKVPSTKTQLLPKELLKSGEEVSPSSHPLSQRRMENRNIHDRQNDSHKTKNRNIHDRQNDGTKYYNISLSRYSTSDLSFLRKDTLLTKRPTPLKHSTGIKTSKSPANSSIRERMKELNKVNRADRNKPIVDNIIKRWNEKGSPLPNHKIGKTKIYSKITSAINKALVRNSRSDIYRAIDNYHWLLTETSVKYKLRFAQNGKGYTGLIVKLDEFFRFSRFTTDAPSFKYTFFSWFKECMLDREQLVKKHCEGDPTVAKKIQYEWRNRIGKEGHFEDFMNASHLLTTFYKTHHIKDLHRNHKVTHLITAMIDSGLDYRARDSSVLTKKFVYDSVLLHYFKTTGNYTTPKTHKKQKKNTNTPKPKRKLKFVDRSPIEPTPDEKFIAELIRRKNEKEKAIQKSHGQQLG